MRAHKFDPGKPNEPGYRFDPETGELVTANGSRHRFLPELPANSPVHELIVPGEADETTEDGAAHYLIGGDAAIVDQIVAFYDRAGHEVPDGYAQAAADHAALARDTEGKTADAELARLTARATRLEAIRPPAAPEAIAAAKLAVVKATERKARADVAIAAAKAAAPPPRPAPV